MRRSTTAVFAAALIVVALIAVDVSRRSSREEFAATASAVDSTTDLPILTGAAPTIVSPTWINTEPLDSSLLAGKVVLYDFWTFGCINCKNTLPYVQAWHERYAADGLVVLSIHRPEFDYERDVDSVRSFVAEHGLTYPVAIDNESVNWKAFDNHYWPAFYLHDRSGDRRLVHYGEGKYRATEDAIRALLGVDPSSPRAAT